MPAPLNNAIAFLPAGLAIGQGDDPFVVIVRTSEELGRWLDDSSPALQWIQVEGLIENPDAWAVAAQGAADTPLDVVLSDPEAEFASLYRLVDVRAAREVRVTMPASSGFMKALRLASSLGLPVRLLPGQPSATICQDLIEALDLYLHNPMVDAPIEPFHSLLGAMNGVDTGSMWVIQEEDPAIFARYSDDRVPILSRSSQPAENGPTIARSVERHMEAMLEKGSECVECPWWQMCGGYFKWPDRRYSCTGVKQLFARLAEAAGEFRRDLAEYEIS